MEGCCVPHAAGRLISRVTPLRGCCDALPQQIDLLEPSAQSRQQDIEGSFLAEAKKAVSKGTKPSRVRIAPIPRNFKGDINWRSLEAAWKEAAAAAAAGAAAAAAAAAGAGTGAS